MDPAEHSSQEWSSLSGLYTAEEADFMAQLLDNCPVPEQLYGNFNLEIPSALWHGLESTIVSMTGINSSSHFSQNSHNNSNTDFLSILQGSSYIDNNTSTMNDSVANIGYISMGDAKFSTDEEFGLEVIGDKNFQAHMECEGLVSEPVEEDTTTNNLEKSGKRSRSSMEVRKNKGNVKSRKKPKSAIIGNTEEDRRPDRQEQNMSSEDDAGGSSSLSQKDSEALKLKGKSKSNRGSATDPQGLYAKRRRERINERLRILQNLVPNGTKVDISTMLEEAVQYVKFLQLQIKLLSSDDLWMYAPIAYNGINIGLDLNITPTI